MNSSDKHSADLSKAIADISIIDTHEHIPPEERIYASPKGFFDFFEHYVSSDLVSAGMSREDLERMRSRDAKLGPRERWALMEAYWPFTRTTGYGKAMTTYIRDLFGVDDINAETIETLDAKVRAAHQPGWYRQVLREKAGIELALVITWPGEAVQVDQSLFRAVPILDHFALATTRTELEGLEAECGCAIQSLGQLETALGERIESFAGEGIAAIKIFQAYRRTLHFEAVDRPTASRCFDRLWLSSPGTLSFEEVKPLQDYITWKILEGAADHRLPVQVHTGLQEGNGNYLAHSRPTLLTNLLLHFSDVPFDIFHAGFPYSGEVAVLAKSFPNAYADLCWLHALSPTAAERILSEWLELIPLNKILAFGGDSNYVEGAYGHCQAARESTARVLGEKLARGWYREAEAITIAQRILRENARSLFRLP